MTTRDLARELAAICGQTAEPVVDAVYLRLLSHMVHWSDGYGITPQANGERGLARVLAKRHGYFWLPCVLCGKWHGGHECNIAGFMVTRNTGIGVCDEAACAVEAERLRNAYPDGIEQADAPTTVGTGD